MFCLSQSSEYAILALACLTVNNDRRTKVHEISDCTGIPKPYLSKILHRLSRSNLVDGKRGTTGGYALTLPPDQIDLLQVARSIEGEELMPGCLLGLAHCSDGDACLTRGFWSDVCTQIEMGLSAISILNMAEHARDRLFHCSACRPHEIKKEELG